MRSRNGDRLGLDIVVAGGHHVRSDHVRNRRILLCKTLQRPRRRRSLPLLLSADIFIPLTGWSNAFSSKELEIISTRRLW